VLSRSAPHFPGVGEFGEGPVTGEFRLSGKSLCPLGGVLSACAKLKGGSRVSDSRDAEQSVTEEPAFADLDDIRTDPIIGAIVIATVEPVSHPDAADGRYPVDRLSAEADLLISPELVLVDPELAQVARALLPCGGEAETGVSAARPVPATPASITARIPGDAGLGRAIAESITPRSLPQPQSDGEDPNSGPLVTGAGIFEPDRDRLLPARVSRRIVVWTILILAALTPVFVVLDFDFEPEVRILSRQAHGEDTDDPQSSPQAITSGKPMRDGNSSRRLDSYRRAAQVRRGNPRSEGRAARVRPASPRNEGRAGRVPPASPRSKSRGFSRKSGQEDVRTPPSNVLGVVMTAGDRMVRLRWARPPDSHHVVVLRERGVRIRGTVVYRDGKVVYRGTATSYKDRGVKNGVVHRYVIVSYDRAGNASSGVPTVVVPKRIPPPSRA
jgi:hypothetical protein